MVRSAIGSLRDSCGRVVDRRLCAGVVGVAFAVGFALVWLVPGAQNDFVYDWLTASAVVRGEDPYQSIEVLAAAQDLGSAQQLDEIHPRIPAGLLVQAPLGLVPFELSYEVGRLLTVASAFWFAWVMARLARIPAALLFAAVPIVLTVWPLSTVLFYSQSGFLIAGLIGFTWLHSNRGWAGVPLAVAISMKLWPWLLIPALWLDGRRRAAYTAIGTFLALNAVGLALPHVSLKGVSMALDDAVSFQAASIAAVVGLHPISSALIGLGVIGLLSFATEQVYPWSVAASLAVAPFVWPHYLPALLVPLAVVLARPLGPATSQTRRERSSRRDSTER